MVRFTNGEHKENTKTTEEKKAMSRRVRFIFTATPLLFE
jgi:hypothetical protein